jgi:hypothetical protein
MDIKKSVVVGTSFLDAVIFFAKGADSVKDAMFALDTLIQSGPGSEILIEIISESMHLEVVTSAVEYLKQHFNGITPEKCLFLLSYKRAWWEGGLSALMDLVKLFIEHKDTEVKDLLKANNFPLDNTPRALVQEAILDKSENINHFVVIARVPATEELGLLACQKLVKDFSSKLGVVVKDCKDFPNVRKLAEKFKCALED